MLVTFKTRVLHNRKTWQISPFTAFLHTSRAPEMSGKFKGMWFLTLEFDSSYIYCSSVFCYLAKWSCHRKWICNNFYLNLFKHKIISRMYNLPLTGIVIFISLSLSALFRDPSLIFRYTFQIWWREWRDEELRTFTFALILGRGKRRGGGTFSAYFFETTRWARKVFIFVALLTSGLVIFNIHGQHAKWGCSWESGPNL